MKKKPFFSLISISALLMMLSVFFAFSCRGTREIVTAREIGLYLDGDLRGESGGEYRLRGLLGGKRELESGDAYWLAREAFRKGEYRLWRVLLRDLWAGEDLYWKQKAAEALLQGHEERRDWAEAAHIAVIGRSFFPDNLTIYRGLLRGSYYSGRQMPEEPLPDGGWLRDPVVLSFLAAAVIRDERPEGPERLKQFLLYGENSGEPERFFTEHAGLFSGERRERLLEDPLIAAALAYYGGEYNRVPALLGPEPDSREAEDRFLHHRFRGFAFYHQGQYEAAAKAFGSALKSGGAPNPDRMLWYRLKSELQQLGRKALPAFERAALQWQDPWYFSDILEELITELVGAREWTALKAMLLWPEQGKRLSRDVQQRLRYITARAVESGFLSGGVSPGDRSPDEHYRQLVESRSDHQIPSYYQLLAAARLGTVLRLSDTGGGEAGGDDPGRDDGLLFSALAHGEGAALYRQLMAGELSLSGEALRILADELYRQGAYSRSLRVAARLNRYGRRPYYRDDYLRSYPRPYGGSIGQAAEAEGLDAALFTGLIRRESAFESAVVSWAGAVGLCQIMPATAEDIAGRLRISAYDLTEPDDNLRMGSWYLAWLHDYLPTGGEAVMAYNGGPGRIRRLRRLWPDFPPDLFAEAVPVRETREYGRYVLENAALYGYLYQQRPFSESVALFYPEI